MMSELEEFLTNTFKSRLEQITGEVIADYSAMKKVCSTLWWLRSSHEPLKEEIQPSSADWNYISAIMDSNLFLEGGLITEETMQLGAFDFMNIMLAISKKVVEPFHFNNEIWEN